MLLFCLDTARLKHFLVSNVVVYKHQLFIFYRSVCENGTRKSLYVHRLVMDAFNANNDTQLCINHIDGVKTNNKLNNLEWVTRSENQKHAYRLGLQTPSDNGLKKTVSIFKNEVLLDTKVSIRELCRSFNLDRRTVQRTIAGIYKHHKGYTFKINETTRK